MTDPYSHIKKEYKSGHCYRNAVRYLYDESDESVNFRLVHGWVSGKNEISGIRFSHAWVENIVTGMCIDPSHRPESPLILPRLAYYHLGQINPDRLHSYTIEEMYENLARYATYGPWNNEFDEL